MKKIPTLFERVFQGHKIIDILPNVTPGFEWVLQGEGVATLKFDGSCCAIFDGVFYKRYDAKQGKPIPANAIKCQEEADPVTGHLPCWVPCDRNNPSDRWFWAAYDFGETLKPCACDEALTDGTYEAVGPHFQSNPYELSHDRLVRHGEFVVHVERTFAGIRTYLVEHEIEGLVFWKDGQPQCKIKRSDFGLNWNRKH